MDDAPSIYLLALPFVVFAIAGATAALHRLLGEPLGATVAAKLADIAQTLALMLVAYGPAMGYVQRQNAIASAAQQAGGEPRQLPRGPGIERARRGEESDDVDDLHGR